MSERAARALERLRLVLRDAERDGRAWGLVEADPPAPGSGPRVCAVVVAPVQPADSAFAVRTADWETER